MAAGFPLTYLALGLAVGLTLLSTLCLLHFREGVFARISLLMAVVGTSLTVHAAADTFIAGPLKETIYAGSGLLAALAVLLASLMMARLLRQATSGEAATS